MRVLSKSRFKQGLECGTISEIENINDGGAALIAYGKIQYTEMTTQEREEISQSLKRYCELDTLAMVMIYEHLKSIL